MSPLICGNRLINDYKSRVWTPHSKRTGLLARKIGMLPQWLNDGTRVLCTLLEFPQNQVVSAVDPDSWYRLVIYFISWNLILNLI